MIELYTGNCRTFLSNYNGPEFDAVITDPPYSSGGATLSERAASTATKYTNTKRKCPFPDFAGDQMDARSWLHMMADVFADARVHCHEGAVLVAFCDWRQMPLLSDAVQWAGWMWRGTIVWDKLSSRPRRGRDGAGRNGERMEVHFLRRQRKRLRGWKLPCAVRGAGSGEAGRFGGHDHRFGGQPVCPGRRLSGADREH